MQSSEQNSSSRSMLFTKLAALEQNGAGNERLYLLAAHDSPEIYKAKLEILAKDFHAAEAPAAELLRRSELFLPWEMSIMLIGLGLNQSQAVFQRLGQHYELVQRAWIRCRQELFILLLLLTLTSVGAAWSSTALDGAGGLQLLVRALLPPLLLAAVILSVIALVHRGRQGFNYWFLPQFLSWIPAVQSLNTAASLYHYLMNLALCVRVGLPLQKALNLCAKAEANPLMRDRYQKIALDVQSGASLSQAFKNSQLLNETRLIALGQPPAQTEPGEASSGPASTQAKIAEIVKASFAEQLQFHARWLPRGLYLLIPLVWLV